MSSAEGLVLDAPDPVDGNAGRSANQFPVILAVGLALLTAISIVPDKLQALDVVCLMALPLIASQVKQYGAVRLLVLSLIAWLAGQLLSDQVNGLGVQTSIQLLTAAAILAIVPMLIFLARGDFRRMRCLIIGVAAGQVILEVTLYGPISWPESWKFGLNAPVSIALLALTDLSWRRGRRAPSFIALGLICVLGVATDHRHLAGIAVLTVILLLLFRGGRQRHPRTISVLAGVTLLLAALSGAFIQAAESGVLGERSGGQVEQYGSSPQTILVNVRPEPFQEYYLFTQRPLLGWGSHPSLDSEAYLGSKQFLRSLGVVREDLDDLWLNTDVPGVPAHSQMMDSLARAGLLAAPFWLLLLGLAMVSGARAIRLRSSPLLVLWTILVMWDAIFSPLTGHSHIEIAAYLALAISSLGQRSESGTRDA